MTGGGLLLVALVPAALAPLLLPGGRGREVGLAVAPWGALPALALALALSLGGGAVVPPSPAPWLFPGTRLGLDPTGRVFLLLAALVWTASGAFARPYLAADPERHRYFLFHSLTVTGSLGLAVAADAVTFYLFFALMTFSAYGLVVHDGRAESRTAGRVYILLAVLGEAMLLAALLLAVSAATDAGIEAVASAVATSPRRDLMVGLFLAGFGIKAGIVPLHVWLPLAHPRAPTPASAALSGVMIKAGILGWLRFLPLGEAALPLWGRGLAVAGLITILLAVVVGVTQDEGKAVLAYSSVGQMGILALVVAGALADPGRAGIAVAACILYAFQHGLAKSALFLGEGVARVAPGEGRAARRRTLLGLVLAALALAGAPFTVGMVGKDLLKAALADVPALLPVPPSVVLSLAAAGTSLLMLRFLVLAAPRSAAGGDSGSAPGPAPETRSRSSAGDTPSRQLGRLRRQWALLVAAVMALPPVLLRLLPGAALPAPHWTPPALWGALWPVAGGALLGGIAALVSLRTGRSLPGIPPGDLLVPARRLLASGGLRRAQRVPEGPDPVGSLASRWYGVYAGSRPTDRLLRAEIALTRWEVAALAAVAVVLALFVLLHAGRAP